MATKGGIDKFVYRRFERTCSYRRRASSAGAVSPQRPQMQGRTYLVRSDLACRISFVTASGDAGYGIAPKTPSMTHPAQRVMPNGPVGPKLQHLECISKVACCACVPTDGAPLFGHNIGGF
jgi:hypothetical protein